MKTVKKHVGRRQHDSICIVPEVVDTIHAGCQSVGVPAATFVIIVPGIKQCKKLLEGPTT